MARITLIDENATPEIAALSAKIRGARGGTLHAFYRALMHAPGLASAWFDFNNAVRFQSALDERLREIVIMRIAALCGCDYVWKVHEARYAAPAGVTPQEMASLAQPGAPAVFGARESALLAYVDAMTRSGAVPDAAFEELRRHFSDPEVVELTVLAGAYNMHVRVLNALGIEHEQK